MGYISAPATSEQLSLQVEFQTPWLRENSLISFLLSAWTGINSVGAIHGRELYGHEKWFLLP